VIGLGIAVVHFLQVQVLVLLQQYQKSIGIAIAILFLKFVLVLVLPILFKSIVDNPGRAQLLHKFNPRKWWREVKKLTGKRAFCSVDQLLSV